MMIKKNLLLLLLTGIFNIVIVRSEDNIPRIKLLAQRSIDTGSVLEWSHDGEMLAVGTSEGIRLYSDRLEFLKLLPQDAVNMCTAEWSANGNYIAAAGFGRGMRAHAKIYIWDVHNSKMIVSLSNPEATLSDALTWSPDSRFIASDNIANEIDLWNAFTGEHVRSIKSPPVVSLSGATYANNILFLDWSPDGARIASVISDVRIMIWDPTTGERILEFKETDPYPPDPYVVQWSPDGRMLADNYHVMDATTGETITTFYEIEVFDDLPQPSFVDWHPNSRYLAVRHKEQVYIYDIVQKMRLGEFTVGGEPEFGCTEPKTIDWHPDGKRLASISDKGLVQIWQVFED